MTLEAGWGTQPSPSGQIASVCEQRASTNLGRKLVTRREEIFKQR